MARRWRIRHKLVLGLATALGIVALLLAGTLNGLWSYYVTMKAIAAKLEEMDEAENLKNAVGRLRDSGRPDDFIEYVFHLKEKQIADAEQALREVDNKVQTTLARDLPGDDGAQILGDIEALQRQLKELRALCDLPAEVTEGGGIGDPQERYRPYRAATQDKVNEVERTSNDLRSAIRENLQERIKKSSAYYRLTLWILLSVGIIGLLLTVSGLRLFYSWIVNSISDLHQGVTRAARGDFEHRIEVRSGDEMEELAEAYNDMACRLRDLYRDMTGQINERSRQLVRSERLASVGFLAAGVAHEINNPLASIAFCSEALEARLEELRLQLGKAGPGSREIEVFAKYLKMIQEEAFRCKKITERLLEVSRGSEDRRERTDLAHLVGSVLEVTQHHPLSRNKQIVFEPRFPVFAWVCGEEVKQVVLNLVFNALESMDEEGTLTIELGQKGGMAELAFTDTGCGMSAEVLENIFEPFFTRSRSGKGTGLGLTITHRIVSQHRGEIEAASAGAGQGSTFRVRLPLEPPADQEKEANLGNAAA